MKSAALIPVLVAALCVTGCASGSSKRGWVSRDSAQSFETARSACIQVSYGNEDRFITCMAGRGWTKPKR